MGIGLSIVLAAIATLVADSNEHINRHRRPLRPKRGPAASPELPPLDAGRR